MLDTKHEMSFRVQTVFAFYMFYCLVPLLLLRNVLAFAVKHFARFYKQLILLVKNCTSLSTTAVKALANLRPHETCAYAPETIITDQHNIKPHCRGSTERGRSNGKHSYK